MRFVELTCNSCGAALNVDIDGLQAYCPYCGKKHLFDLDQMELILAEKERTKRSVEETKRAQEKTKRAEVETEKFRIQQEYQDRKDRRQKRQEKVEHITALVAGFGCFVLGFIALSLLWKLI